MEITYYGGKSFVITANPIVAINPVESINGTVVLQAERKRAAKLLVAGPGEYEIKGALITTVPAGEPRSELLAHAIGVDGLNVLFLQGPAGVLTGEALTSIGIIDVLIVDTVDARAAEQLARDLTPRVVVPYGDGAQKMVETLGVKDPEPIAKLAWDGIKSVPKAVLLKELKARKKAA